MTALQKDKSNPVRTKTIKKYGKEHTWTMECTLTHTRNDMV